MLLVDTDLKEGFALGEKTVASSKKTFASDEKTLLWARRLLLQARRLFASHKKTFASNEKTFDWFGQEDFAKQAIGAIAAHYITGQDKSSSCTISCSTFHKPNIPNPA